MSIHDQQPEILDSDAWPLVEIKRQPNGKLGVNVCFPLPPEARAATGVDEFSMNMEPQRARRLRDQLTAHLKEMGFDG